MTAVSVEEFMCALERVHSGALYTSITSPDSGAADAPQASDVVAIPVDVTLGSDPSGVAISEF